MPVVAIVPAAGKAERFGGEKLVVDIKGEPLLNWTLWSLLDGGVGKVVVVTAPGADFRNVKLTTDPRVLLVVNTDPSRGMLSSVQTGLSVVSGDPLLFLPADMPFINSSTVTAITTACIRRQRVIVPVHHERRGHPIAVPGILRRQILSAPPDATLKDALGDAERIELPVSDAGILRDVDRPADLD
jgi:molybdenum cofactor cytidylyltransferase